MALKTISSKDLKVSRSFTDLGISMVKNSFTDDVSTKKNDNAIKQAVRNLILTRPGEKPFQPNKGSAVQGLLFEQLDTFTADVVKEEIINTINQNEPRVVLQDVQVMPVNTGNKLNVYIEYKIVGVPIVETIEFVLQRPE